MSTLTRAGRVITTEIATVRNTPYSGTPVDVSCLHTRLPGTAPSRLKAKSILVVLVIHATVQKNCPAVEINRTVPPHFWVRAWEKITATPPPPEVTLPSFWTANRNERSRI